MNKSCFTVGFLKAKINYTLIALVVFGLFLKTNSHSQSPVTVINTSVVPATPSTYTVGLDTYQWGQGDDVFLTSVELSGGKVFQYDAGLSRTVVLQRVNNSLSTGFRTRLFAEQVGGNRKLSAATYPTANGDGSRIEDLLLKPILNRGALDLFHNIDDSGARQFSNNIERVDVMYSPFNAPGRTSYLDEIGFLVSEKSGNNEMKMAVILSVDIAGNPTSYGSLVSIDQPNYGMPNALLRWNFYQNASAPPQGNEVDYFESNERYGISVVTFSDLGVTPGQIIYGVSFFGADVTTANDLTDPTSFPDNTNEGADVHGGLGGLVKTVSVSVLDSDNDGIADVIDVDDDNDGILDVDESAGDTDGDGIADYLDLDSDNDGCPDAIEGSGGNTLSDINALGALSAAVDAVGLPGGTSQSTTLGVTDASIMSAICDSDGDGIGFARDIDQDNDGILDKVEGVTVDSDGDGVFNYLDLDSDNDGIADIVEYGLPDVDNDGRIDSMTDNDNNGYDDGLNTELYPQTNAASIDSEFDATTDWSNFGVSIDSDGSSSVFGSRSLRTENITTTGGRRSQFEFSVVPGDKYVITAWARASSVANSHSFGGWDGFSDFTDTAIASTDWQEYSWVVTANATDAIIRVYPSFNNSGITGDQVFVDGVSIRRIASIIDTDNDGLEDYLDLDSDNDGCPDAIEGAGGNTLSDINAVGSLLAVSNTEGVPGGVLQSTTSGVTDASIMSAICDSDGDNVGFFIDIDDDNDGILDDIEGVTIDTDNDGIFNNLDLDSDNDGIADIVEYGLPDTDNDGRVDSFTDTNLNGYDESLEVLMPELYPQTNAASIDSEFDATTDWSNFGVSIDSDGSSSVFGSRSLRTENITTTGGRRSQFEFSVVPGDKYVITAWARASSVTNSHSFGGWDGFSDFTDTAISSTDWKKYTWVVTANATNAIIRIYPSFNDSGITGDQVFVDGVSIRRIASIIDTDNDDYENFLDLDSDGDGIPDNIEAQTTLGYVSPDGTFDTNGFDTAYSGGLTPVNTDGDGEPDYLDLDSDNEGANDTTEAGLTLSGTIGNNGLDGGSESVDDYTDVNGNFNTPVTDFPDTDKDVNYGGDLDYRDKFFNPDTDGDDVPNIGDLDSDNDGILDVTEGGGQDPTVDGDNDGVPFYLDDNDTVDTIGDDNGAIEPGFDTDGDGVPNHLDLDSDDDGISDVIEAGGTDADGDGRVDYATSGDPTTLVDTNNNGLLDTLESVLGGTPLPVTNSDSDAFPNYLDIDSDGDGIVDIIEAQISIDNGGYRAPLLTDTDGDGLDDSFDKDNLGNVVPVDTDGDSLPDYVDINSDGDSENDDLEAHDLNNNSIIDGAELSLDGTDIDSDGLDDGYDLVSGGWDSTNGGQDANSFPNNDPTLTDTDRDWRESLDIDNDNDGVDDPTDLDDDNDGVSDIDESNGNNPDGDLDGDGIPNWQDTTDDTGLNDPTYIDNDGNGIPDVYDQDGDGVPNHIDLDSDNDGIYDIVESGFIDALNNIVDVNNDGRIDAANSGTVDTNGQFPVVVGLTPLNSDGDILIDLLDLNSDSDDPAVENCFDSVEARFTLTPTDADLDNNGFLGVGTFGAGLTVDADGKVTSAGFNSYVLAPANVNGNTVLDFQEVSVTTIITTQPTAPAGILAGGNVSISVISSGNTYQWQESTDGITWINVTNGGTAPEFVGATTNTLTVNNVPATYGGRQFRVVASTNNFACDTALPSDAVAITILGDNDGDGIADVIDLDDDNDGIPDTVENTGVPADFDGDGIDNQFDLDSDNDGIYDVVESGQLNGTTIVDSNNDGRIDGADTGSGADGLFDLLDLATNPNADSDSDGIVDSNDLNSDDDGCPDVTEAGYTEPESPSDPGFGLLGSGTFGFGLTVDANGVVTSGVDGYTPPLDGDSNGTLDFQEVGQAVTLNSQQPIGEVIVINANANFDVTGSLAPVYQWYESTDGGTTWNPISNGGTNPTYSGANTDALTLTMVPGSYDGYQYRVVLSSPAYACDGNITSNPATLTVHPDFDGDGVGDPIDTDSDNDGIPNSDEYNGANPYADVDGDGVPAYLDDNDNNISVGDNDGAVQPAYDTDEDDVANHLDIDADGDGIYDVNEAGHGNLDTNGDGFIDGANLGSGTNGLFDGIETTPESGVINYPLTDSDSNSVPNFLDADDDGDGVPTSSENPDPNNDGNPTDAQDTDGDGIADYLDIDDDNDGVLTSVEGTDNPDGDGRPNYLDLDSDGDGLPDNVEVQTTTGYIVPSGNDDDNDGLDNAYDADNAGYVNSEGLMPVNTDTTDNPDYLDPDSDNDNVPDLIEGNDANHNGEPDILPTIDSDNDGLSDSFDGSVGDYADPNGLLVTTTPATDLPDTDADVITGGNVDYRDTDDDGDGILTKFEDLNNDGDYANDDTDANGTPNYLDNDDDGDNVLTANENADPNGDGNPIDAVDTDGDKTPDYLDNDDDDDGVPTIEEDPNGDGDPMNDNSDGDGVANYLDIDDDNDGILTKIEGDNNDNDDTDPYPNYLDQDADGDGIPDNVEAQTTEGYINPDNADSDNDGLDNAYDDEVGYKDSLGLTPEDTDTDGTEDYLDSDSDNDNVPDFVEGFDFSDPANLIIAPNGEPDIEFSGNDDDKDGLDDAFDGDLSGFGDPNGKIIGTDPEVDLPNRDLFIYEFYDNSSSPLSPITPDNEVDYRDTDDDGDGRPTASAQEDRDVDGDPRNDNCNGPPDNNTPNYLDPIDCERIPTGFSPNGDHNNEAFIIPGVDKYPNFSVEIFDRWGNIVYEYENKGKEEPEWWDGHSTGSRTIAKGQKVPVGTYYYIIKFNGTDGKAPKVGWVYVNY